ncbi:arginine repressor [Amygdalobacter nucleatus]|uniref:Arginine repressor n=1 Tax=Amygdalobacter nucleatus TaxID=3029274 RepID=A0A133Y7C3_9FIRM|nr:hypothetical protein [Amygdalobacter nucleatus]KXB39122.1 putative arginine repressor [Amygdalobacter nucleatus]MDF0485544.1 hypothetical protein [Amygdalobacter nucleatus]WEG36601.1 hypothetical protein PYS63_05510 [Amygdalobacter nucleatus]
MRKYVRQAKIAELIQANVITTQQQLMNLLAEEEIFVSQVTLSRDLQEMAVEKVRDVHGQMFYSLPVRTETEQQDQQVMKQLFQVSCEQVLVLDKLVCIRLLKAAAPILKLYFKQLKLKGVAAIMTDTDEIWLLCFSKQDSEKVGRFLQAVLHESTSY